MTEEIWKPVEVYERFYQISNLGNLKSNDRKVWNGKCFANKKGKILAKTLTSTGYWKVGLVNELGERKSKKIHRLVAIAFIPKVEGKNFVNHIDLNRLNNNVDNLEWCTRTENMDHAYEHGKRKSKIYGNEKEIIETYLNNPNFGCGNVGKKFGCDGKTVKRFLEKNDVRIKTRKEIRTIYKVNESELFKDFDSKIKRSLIIEKHKISLPVYKKYRKMYKERLLK